MKKLTLCFIVLVSWQLIFIPLVFAADDEYQAPIKIGSYLTSGLITEDGTGMFNKLNNAIFMEMGRSNELRLSSVNRARKGIKDGKLVAYFPELWENLSDDKSQYVVSIPFFYKRIILFTLKGSALTKLSDFKSEFLGIVKGFSYGKKIKNNSHLKLVSQENDVINIKLLLNKRISGVLGGYPGTVMAVEKTDTSNKVHYNLNKPIAVLESFYVCKNDPEGVKLCNSINKAIRSLLQKGILELNGDTGISRFNPIKNH